MKKISIITLLIIIILALASCASRLPTAENSNDNRQNNHLYDYQKLYDYKSNYIGDASNVRELLNHLSYPGKLAIEKIALNTDTPPYGLVVQFQLQVRENEEYTVDYTTLIRDSILLFALIDNLDYIEYDFVQGEYGYSTQITREIADEVLGASASSYGENQEMFLKELPAKLDAITYNPDVKSTITYDDIQGIE